MSALGTEAPSTRGEKHWTHRFKDRIRPALGEANGAARLDRGRVRFIRASSLSTSMLAVALGVSESTVRRVRLGETWRWL